MAIKAEDFIAPTEEDLRNDLTADERTAIEEAEKDEAAELKAAGDDADAAALADAGAEKDKGDDGADDKAGTAEAKDKDDEADKPDAAATEAEDDDKENDDAAAADDKQRAPRQAVPDWQAPENAAAKLKEINDKRDAIAEKFDAGELSAKDLLSQQRELDAQERAIERAKDRAEMRHEMTVAVWQQTTVPEFMEKHSHYSENPTLWNMLDAEVRRRQVEAEKNGKDQFAPSILLDADKAIRKSLAKLGIAKPEADEADDKQPAADEQNKQQAVGADGKKPGKPEMPPSLAKIPASDITGTDSKYSALDRLADKDPTAFEDAMAKLPEAEKEAYLARH